ncbi:hypothetical protein [Mesorhizobium sp.]|nr:hypothetical protein [Mesorhizobium sp.]
MAFEMNSLALSLTSDEPVQFPGNQVPSTVLNSAPLPYRRISAADLTSA